MTALEKIRAEILDTFLWEGETEENLNNGVRKCLEIIDKYAEQEPKIGYCRDCKWWKDSDGAYRRGMSLGVPVESKCPISRKVVFEGNGYCYMFEPQQESEGKDE